MTILTSPVGELNFLAHITPQTNKYTGRSEYSARIEVDGKAEGAQDFLKAIRAVNRNLGSEDKVKQPGNFFVNAKSKNKPTIVDKDGTVIQADMVPMIESGTVRLILKPFTAKAGGGLSLEGIQLVDVVEFTGGGSAISEDELKAALKGS